MAGPACVVECQLPRLGVGALARWLLGHSRELQKHQECDAHQSRDYGAGHKASWRLVNASAIASVAASDSAKPPVISLDGDGPAAPADPLPRILPIIIIVAVASVVALAVSRPTDTNFEARSFKIYALSQALRRGGSSKGSHRGLRVSPRSRARAHGRRAVDRPTLHACRSRKRAGKRSLECLSEPNPQMRVDKPHIRRVERRRLRRARRRRRSRPHHEGHAISQGAPWV